MRKLLFGAAAAVCFGAVGPALANGSLKDVEPVYEPVPVWSGCYFGANVGVVGFEDHDANNFKKSKEFDENSKKYYDSSEYLFEEGDTKKEKTEKIHAEYEYYKDKGMEDDFWKDVRKFDFDGDDDEGAVGGIHAGCNWQRNQFVFGIEADIGTGRNLDYLGSLRGRLGYAWNKSHIYITGGVAFAEFDRDLEFRDYDDNGDLFFEDRFDNSDEETGYVVGAGWEYMIEQNLSFGIEGLYYGFDDDDNDHKFVAGKDGKYHLYKFDEERDNELYVIRARLTYHLRRAPEPLK